MALVRTNELRYFVREIREVIDGEYRIVQETVLQQLWLGSLPDIDTWIDIPTETKG